MTGLTCAEITTLLSAYVLNALDAEERGDLLEHLAECRLHDFDLQAEREAALLLVDEVPEVAPPESLRTSLLDAFDSEVAGTLPSETQVAPSEAEIAPSRPEPAPSEAEIAPVLIAPRPGRIRSLARSPAFAYSLAAGLLVLAVALGVWGTSRDGGPEGGVRLAAARGDDTRLYVTYLPDRDLAVLNLDLPPPPTGRSYQAWSIVDGRPVSLGVVAQNTGTVVIAADLDNAQAVAISVEPLGGSEQPTTTPIIRSQF